MSDEELKVPSEDEIRELPRWARVAFAARCARRVQPLFLRFWKNAPRESVEAIERAIAFAEYVGSSGLTDVVHSISAVSKMAYIPQSDEYSEQVRKATHSAASASSAYAAMAASDAADAANSNAAAVHSAMTNSIIAAGSWSASSAESDKVVYTQATAAANAVRSAMRRDYALLRKASERLGWDDETPVPVAFFGPLWPMGEPEGWPKDEEPDAGQEPPALKLELRIPAGLTGKQSKDFNERVKRFLCALNGVHLSMGGNGLQILDDASYEPAPVEEEAPFDCDACKDREGVTA